nr:unnamed protein product [Callosobruchus chinensis]
MHDPEMPDRVAVADIPAGDIPTPGTDVWNISGSSNGTWHGLWPLSLAASRLPRHLPCSGYITNRHQCVSVNNKTSAITMIPSGVPQGSILGPTLFIIYTFDLASVFNDSYIQCFADDSQIVHYFDADDSENGYFTCKQTWAESVIVLLITVSSSTADTNDNLATPHCDPNLYPEATTFIYIKPTVSPEGRAAPSVIN